MFGSVILFGAAVLATGIASASAQSVLDLIIHSGDIVTLDGKGGRAQAVGIRDGRIVSVGSNAQILPQAGAATRKIDAAGRPVIPGLIDAHIHVANFRGLAGNLPKVQVRDLASIQDLLDALRARAGRTPKGHWVTTASDWHESQLKEGRLPTRWELDTVTPDHPVFIARGGHNAVLNSLALKRAGIAEDAPDPKGGHYVRDNRDRITGWILERPAIMRVLRKIPKPDPKAFLANLRKAINTLNAVGVTSVRDMHVTPPGLKAWRAVRKSGDLTLRVYTMLSIHPRRPAKVDIGMLTKLGVKPGEGDEWLRVGGLKMTHDGGVETSHLKQDFANKPGFKGIAVTPLEKVRAITQWACRNGWQVGTHTVGDAAIEDVLKVYEEVNRTCPIVGKRWALEHPYLPSAADMAKIKRLGVKVTTQTGHNYTLGAGWIEFWGKDRANAAIPNRRYIDNGILPGGGTDAPVTPFNPFLAMWGDVNRNTKAVGKLGPDQGVTPLEALKMHTVWAAAVTGEETLKGTIEVGKLADLVVISDDILSVAPDRIKDIRAEVTIVGGKVVYRR